MKRIAVYQPGYFQSLHYYARMMSVDTFVILGDAQINRKVGQASAKVYGKGGTVELTVPIKGGNRITLDEAVPDYSSGWTGKHLAILEHTYRKAPMFERGFGWASDMLSYAAHTEATLSELGLGQARDISSLLGYEGRILRSPFRVPGRTGSEWMLDICKAHRADVYVCGKVAYDSYLDRAAFEQAGIQIEVQDWTCKEYKQMGKEFVPNLSIIDLLMNCSADEAASILKG